MKIQRDYGGAYDIDPHMYFTKDDLLDLAYAVIDILNQDATEDSYYDIKDIWIDNENNIIYMSAISPEENFVDGEVKVDMRRIRLPKDLLKYAPKLAQDIIREISKRKLYRYYSNDLDTAFDELVNKEH